MAQKFITNNNNNENNIHAKHKNDGDGDGDGDKDDKNENPEINGKRVIFVSTLSRGYFGLMKIFSNVSMSVLENIHSLIPDLGLVSNKGPILIYLTFISNFMLSYFFLCHVILCYLNFSCQLT